jgi:hypothetical protein
MDDDTLPGGVVFPAWRVTPAWAERGMVALIALLGVHEGRFAWGLLGLVLFALLLVAVALVIGFVALRRSRRALAEVSAVVAGGLEPEAEAVAGRPEPRAVGAPPERPAEEAAPVPAQEPEASLEEVPVEAEQPEAAHEPEAEGPSLVPEQVAVEPSVHGPSVATFEPVAPPAPRSGPAEDVLCECGHAKATHYQVTASKWMCLADVTPACQCRRYAAPPSETASLLRSLQHPDEFVRAAAAAELRGRPEATEALLEALDDDSAHVRLEVVKALEDAQADAAVRKALIEVIAQDLSPSVRQEAVRVLATFLARTDSAGAA